jgi:hypothetical protein
MFYTAEALLNEMGLEFNKHGAVHAAFGKHFAKQICSTQNFTAGSWIIRQALIGVMGGGNLQMDAVALMIHQGQNFGCSKKVFGKNNRRDAVHPYTRKSVKSFG